jgi:hypothetical protein
MIFSSVRNLKNASRRFEAAEHGRVDYVGITWSEFQAFESAVFDYADLASDRILADAQHEELRVLREVRLWLSKMPIHPRHEAIGMQRLNLGRGADSDNELMRARQRCLDTARDLLNSDHPATDLDGIIKAHSTSPDALAGDVVLVAPEKFQAAIRHCVRLIASNFEILSQSQLKHSGTWDLAIYFGAQYDTYPRTPLELRKKKVAWMYSSPASLRTLQLAWSGDFKISDFTTWVESPLTLAREIGPTRFRVFDDPRPIHIPPLPAPPPSGGVPGFVVDLAGGYRVMLAREYGPSAHVMDVDDHAVRIDTEPVESLLPGDAILLRVDRTARDFVSSTAQTIMQKKKMKYQVARAASDNFKRLVEAKAAENFTDAENRLHASGIANPGYYLRVCSEPNYIGPSRVETYRKICTALGLAQSDDEYDLFRQMRAAHRGAGLKARLLIEEKLKEDRSWEDETREEGFCRRNFGELGEILIAAVSSVSVSVVALSALGRVQKDGAYVD